MTGGLVLISSLFEALEWGWGGRQPRGKDPGLQQLLVPFDPPGSTAALREIVHPGQWWRVRKTPWAGWAGSVEGGRYRDLACP